MIFKPVTRPGTGCFLKIIHNQFTMKKMIIAAICMAFIMSCAPGHHGSPPTPPTPPGAPAPPPHP
jgi:hypothetical protein